MLCISVYMAYSGELLHRSLTGGTKRVDDPLFFWVAVALWSLMAVVFITYHFIGKEKFKKHLII